MENDSDEDTNQTAKKPTEAVKKKRRVQEEREECVHNTIEKLKEKHANFTPMQIRIWSEMVAGDLHSSLDEPPKSSMFARAGSGNSTGNRRIVIKHRWLKPSHKLLWQYHQLFHHLQIPLRLEVALPN